MKPRKLFKVTFKPQNREQATTNYIVADSISDVCKAISENRANVDAKLNVEEIEAPVFVVDK